MLAKNTSLKNMVIQKIELYQPNMMKKHQKK